MNTSPGHQHPLSATMQQLVDIFTGLDFEVANGPHIEDQWHNFDALNVPKDHPARDMQDTFFVDNADDLVMRTHTSNVQIRYMENNEPPIKIIAPGQVYRNEATDATHEAQFHQIEGLVVDKGVSLGHLKATLEYFLKKMLGSDIEMRLRPGYFPFVEPGVEVDLKYRGKWLEVLGAGMVHPKVLKNAGIDPHIYSGFAFGMGIDRITMMKYNITDIRPFYQGDLRLHDSLRPVQK